MLRRHRLFFSCLVISLAISITLSASIACRAAITIDTVTIGNPGNLPDTVVMTDGTSGYGSVGYNYRIGKYDVTVGQYTAFLNAVAATDTYGLYHTQMASDLNVAGISRNCIASGCSYSVIGSPNHPIAYVFWGDAARFANWLDNGQPTGAEGPGTTETGAYTLNGAITDAALMAVSRNAGAKWFIPSENEWYKAAYYDPAAGHYWSYATGTNVKPTSAPPGNTPNTANYISDIDGSFAVSGSQDLENTQNYLTDVGAYTDSPSPYGTFDQAGNVNQWTEGLYPIMFSDTVRSLRGGSWITNGSFLPSSSRNADHPADGDLNIGFRVASAVPEPCTATLAILACGLIGWRRKRFSFSQACRRSVVLTLLAPLLPLVSEARAITIDTVQIGKPGNANDPATGDLYGSVGYNYRIGKYDVTVGQYTGFLNAIAATDTYELYNPAMATDLNFAGIARSGASGSYTYNVIGSPNHPVTYVNWGDAARFANWLHNGQPSGDEGSGTTETGAYTLNGATSDAALAAIDRNAGAKWFIPSESEWYKAAYYDPAAGQYWNYATGTNATPISAPPGSTPNTANYYDNTTGFAVTGTTNYDPNQNYLTDVGAFTASASPYGTFDQSGLVFQWNETLIGGSFRGRRGGSFGITANYMAATRRLLSNLPTLESGGDGFRMATVIPEPSTGIIAILGCSVLWRWRNRFNA